jgi:hypothetical protein
MSPTPNRATPAERPSAARHDAPPQDGRTFARQIDCEGAGGPLAGAPARGGGLRDPQEWGRRRDARR